MHVVAQVFHQFLVSAGELRHLFYRVVNLLFYFFYRFLNHLADVCDVLTVDIVGTFDIGDGDCGFVEVQVFLGLHFILFAYLFVLLDHRRGELDGAFEGRRRRKIRFLDLFGLFFRSFEVGQFGNFGHDFLFLLRNDDLEQSGKRECDQNENHYDNRSLVVP